MIFFGAAAQFGIFITSVVDLYTFGPISVRPIRT
jgi:Na+-transporting methylmalonyl-CoA/oxaloacetate decarboxylase beta subunit